MNRLDVETFLNQIVNGYSIDSVEVLEDIGNHNTQSARNNAKLSNSRLRKFLFPKVNYMSYEIVNCTIDELILKEVRINHLKLIGCRIAKITIEQGFDCKALIIEGNVNLKSISATEANLTKIVLHNNQVTDISIVDCIGIDTLEISALEEHSREVNEHIQSENSDSEGSAGVINSIWLQGSFSTVNVSYLLSNVIRCEGAIGLLKMEYVIGEELILDNGSYNEIAIRNCQLKNFTSTSTTTNTRCYGTKCGRMKFLRPFSTLSFGRSSDEPSENEIETLDISGQSGLLDLSHLTLSNFLMDGFKAANGSTFSYLTIEKLWMAENTSLVSAKLSSVSLSNCSTHLLNCDITNTRLTNVEWPHDYELYEYESLLKKQNKDGKLGILWPLKESYRQLKVLSIDQHNKIDALSFQKHELKVYWKIVHLKFKSEFRRKDIGNWLILGTNRLFSDFGQSLFRPLLWLIAVHSVLFYFLLLNFDLGIAPGINLRDWNSDATVTGIGMYLNLMNPVHGTGLINRYLLSETSIYGSVDFLMRVLDGLLIYYIIRATRKFNTSL